jgi:anti-sigma factor RsiW
MTCHQAEELLFESFDDDLGVEARRTLDRHLATCDACSALAAQLRTVDARLTAAFPSVLAPPSIAEGVRREQRRERLGALREGLPDVIHLAGCGVATAVSALLLPVEASTTLSVGVAFTCFSYLLMAVVRSSLEAAEQPDW